MPALEQVDLNHGLYKSLRQKYYLAPGEQPDKSHDNELGEVPGAAQGSGAAAQGAGAERMQKRGKREDPTTPFSALPDVLMDKIVEHLSDKDVRALASTNKAWNRPMLQCLGSAVGAQSTFDESQCTGRAYYHPDTVRATLLCALPAARSLPGSRGAEPVKPVHLYVNKDLIDTCDNDSRVRCFVDAGFPLSVTLLYPLDVDVNKPESMTEQASGKPTDLPTVAGVRPVRALVVGKGSEDGFIIKDSKPCEHGGCTKLAVFRDIRPDANANEIKFLKSTMRALDGKDHLFRPLLSVYFIRNIVKICAPDGPLREDLRAFMTTFRQEFKASFMTPTRLDIAPFHPDNCRMIQERCYFATRLFRSVEDVLQNKLSIQNLKDDVAGLDLDQLRGELTPLLPVTHHDLLDRERGRYCEEHKEPGMIHVDNVDRDVFGEPIWNLHSSHITALKAENTAELYDYDILVNRTMGYIYNATRYLETVRFDDIEPQNIGYGAFLGSNIVELPPMLKLRRIHEQAFYASGKLDTLGEMPLLRKIDKCAFDGCYSLKHLPSTLNTLEKIGSGAFRWSAIETLPDMPRLTRIHHEAFRGCVQLQRLPKMPNLTHIHDQAFRDCTNLKTFHLSGSIRHIGNRAFDNCTHLKVTFEPGVSFDELVCNDLKIREAFEEAKLYLSPPSEDMDTDDTDDEFVHWTGNPYFLADDEDWANLSDDLA